MGWYSTSVFLILIFRPNLFGASEKASTIFCISSAEWATSALSSANSSSLISIRVFFVFALKCVTLNRSALCLDCMQTPSPMSRKASSSIADRKIEKSVGASIQPCLTPFVTLNDSETSHPTLTYAIIPVCRPSIIVMNFCGHPYFLSSCHSPVLPTLSNVLQKSTIQCTVVGPAQCAFLVAVADKISYPWYSGYL